MSDPEIETGIPPELLTAAREAGLTCLHAFRELVEAARKPAKDAAQDQLSLLRVLFAALRNGWEPICRCWPLLQVADATLTFHDRFAINWETVNPLEIWLLVRNLYWQVVWYTKYRGWAALSWFTWWPELQGVSADIASNVTISRMIDDIGSYIVEQVVTNCAPPDSWDGATAAISKALAASEPNLSEVKPPSHFVIPQKPLPRVSGTLERLLREVDELIPCYLDLKRQCSKTRHMFEARLQKLTMLGGHLKIKRPPALPPLPPALEVMEYADRMELTARSYFVTANTLLLEPYYLVLRSGMLSDTPSGWWQKAWERFTGPNVNEEAGRVYMELYRNLEVAFGGILRLLEDLRERIECQMKAIQEGPEPARAKQLQQVENQQSGSDAYKNVLGRAEELQAKTLLFMQKTSVDFEEVKRDIEEVVKAICTPPLEYSVGEQMDKTVAAEERLSLVSSAVKELKFAWVDLAREASKQHADLSINDPLEALVAVESILLQARSSVEGVKARLNDLASEGEACEQKPEFLDELVTISDMASLLRVEPKGLSNRLNQRGIKPNARKRDSRGNKREWFDYTELRAVAAEAYPDRARWLPETWAEAKAELQRLTHPQSERGPTGENADNSPEGESP